MDEHYEVIIVGAGISGCALAYALSRYTDINKIAIIEKYDRIAALNSNGTANSQTIHVGDIETNYSLAKAAITKRTAKMVEKYCLQYGYQNSILFSHQKMALGIGEEEIAFLLHRYEEFSDLFPYLEIWDKETLKTLEPRIVFDKNGNERPEAIVGIGAMHQWTTVDYGKMAQSFIDNAKHAPNMTVDLLLNTLVENIQKNPRRGYTVETQGKKFSADFIVVDAGAHSLYLAHKFGHGLDYACLPVAGSFYLASKHILNGKVYMIQNPKLPFAALHGDPDILVHGNTRFGPTAFVIPKLERFGKGTYLEFWKTLRLDRNVFIALWKLIRESDIRNYIFRNFLFEIPYINKRLFLKDAQKIVPSLGMDEFEYAHGFGGLRPQVIDKKQQKLMLGEVSINTGEGIIFNVTPSPGATSCLGNAERDLRYIVQYLGKTFDEERFNNELTDGEYCVLTEPIEKEMQRANAILNAMKQHEKEYYEETHIGKPHESFWSAPYSLWKNGIIK